MESKTDNKSLPTKRRKYTLQFVVGRTALSKSVVERQDAENLLIHYFCQNGGGKRADENPQGHPSAGGGTRERHFVSPD